MHLSYIVPVFNCQDFIARCLNSICSQQIPDDDYEVIVVDDCSTDKTREIVRELCISHHQIHMLCQKANHRQGAARNLGLKEAKGDYITFVDGDDLVLEGVIPALKWAEQTKADMVYCSCYYEITQTESALKEIEMPEGSVMSGRDFCERYHDLGVFWYPWGSLIRREWLLQLDYPFIEDRQHEDRDWMGYVLSHASTVINSKHPMYRYVYNPTSTCRAARYSTVFDHTASGIRHIRLAKQLKNDCPNLSQTLYDFGVDEIYKSLRLRNLTKFAWVDNKYLYDDKHLRPLLSDLRQVCRQENLPMSIWVVVYMKPVEMLTLAIVSPVAFIGRKTVSRLRLCLNSCQ